MIKIKTRNKDFTGVISGISFVKGIATVEELSEVDKMWFERYGHTVTEVEKLVVEVVVPVVETPVVASVIEEVKTDEVKSTEEPKKDEEVTTPVVEEPKKSNRRNTPPKK